MRGFLILATLFALAAFAFASDEAVIVDETAQAEVVGASSEVPVKSYIFSSRSEFVQAFLSSLAMIFVSELGDKTFFIAAILAMKNPRLQIFSGAFAALAVMTVLSTALGVVVPALIPHSVTHYLSAFFFLIFGVKMIREYTTMSEDEGKEELEEAEEEINAEAQKFESPGKALEEGVEKKRGTMAALLNLLNYVFSPIWIQTFTLTFLAEWGDRSQITTIAMATTQNPFGITFGAIVGHAICTGIAVIGGRMLATRISVKAVTLSGAILFLIFAALGFYQNPETESST